MHRVREEDIEEVEMEEEEGDADDGVDSIQFVRAFLFCHLL